MTLSAVCAWACSVVVAEQPATGPSPQPLATREQELVAQYRELERAFLRLADLLEATDPRRAALLRRVCAEAREGQVSDRLDAVVRQLEQGQLLQAGAGQQGLIEQLQALHGLLASGDDDRRLASSNEEVRRFLARLSKTITRQRDVEAGTEGGAGEEELAARQRKLADETRQLAGEIGDFAKRSAGPSEQAAKAPDAGSPEAATPDDGKQGDQTPPDGEGQPAGDDEVSRAERTARRLASAEERMRQAQSRLAEARRDDARDEQERAIEELESARAELQEILRQLREEEVERLLVRLEARVRDMLRVEKGLVTETRRLAADPRPTTDRSRQLEASRLGREQTEVATAATRALAVVRDDGTAVAVPQALEQVRDDADQAAARLSRGDTGSATTGIQDDIVTGLEELLAALERARSDPQTARQGGAGGRAPEPGDQPLVDGLAELKMLRSLQVRVNTRTGRFARLLGEGVEEAEEPELREALGRLADRQRSIEQAAHDIVTGRTE